MKKLVIILSIVGLSVGAIVAGNSEAQKTPVVIDPTPVPVLASPTPTPTPTPYPVEIPLKLAIPAIEVNAEVESVGLEAGGRMAVPAKWEDVGWYNLGVKPGEQGQAVIAGHLDSPTGPAIFIDLDKLMKGDEIVVTDQEGVRRTFIVYGKQTYSDAEFPLMEIFGPSDEFRLNLITCQGTFNRQQQNYSHRLVVFAKLAQEER